MEQSYELAEPASVTEAFGVLKIPAKNNKKNSFKNKKSARRRTDYDANCFCGKNKPNVGVPPTGSTFVLLKVSVSCRMKTWFGLFF